MSLSISMLPHKAKIKVKSSDKMWSKFFIFTKINVDAFIFNKNIKNINKKLQTGLLQQKLF